MQTLTLEVEVHDPYRLNGRASLTWISRGPLSEDSLPSLVELIGDDGDDSGLVSYVPSVRARFFDVTLPLFVGDDVEFGFGSFLFSRDAHEGLPSGFDGCAVQFAEQDVLVGYQTNVSPPSRDVIEGIDDVYKERTFRAQPPAAQRSFVDIGVGASTRIEIRRSIEMVGMSIEDLPAFRSAKEIVVRFSNSVAMGDALAVVNALHYLAGLLARYRISVTTLPLAWNESHAVMGGATFTSNAHELPHGHDGMLFDAIPHSERLFQAIDEAPLAFQRLNRCLPRQNSWTSTALIGLCGAVEAMIKVFGLSGCVPKSGRHPSLCGEFCTSLSQVTVTDTVWGFRADFGGAMHLGGDAMLYAATSSDNSKPSGGASFNRRHIRALNQSIPSILPRRLHTQFSACAMQT